MKCYNSVILIEFLKKNLDNFARFTEKNNEQRFREDKTSYSLKKFYFILYKELLYPLVSPNIKMM